MNLEALHHQPLTRRAQLALLLSPATLLYGCGPGEVDSGSSSGSATSAPTITTQPVSVAQQFTASTATFTVVASGGGLSYQWYSGSQLIAGATQSSYSTSTTGSYSCVVSNSLGSVTSNTVTLTLSLKPVINVQPISATVTTGTSATLSVLASGLSLSYQWYDGGTAISGATGASLVTATAGSYYVVVSSGVSGAGSVTSSTATVSISSAAIAPTIVTQPSALQVTAGQTAIFSVVAAGTNLSYQWYFNGVTVLGATSPSYQIASTAALNGGSYYVIVTNSLGYISSQYVTLTVTPVASNSNTALMVGLANQFLSTLTSAQQIVSTAAGATSTVLFQTAQSNAIAWTNLPGARHGLRLNIASMSTTQLAAADALITAALSSTGATTVSEIRLSDDVYASTYGVSTAGSGMYSIALLGQPSVTTPWMLQLSGHQLGLNISYNAPKVSATPLFLGIDPPNWAFSSGGSYNLQNNASSSGTPHAALETQRAAVSALATALQADSVASVTALLSGSITSLVMGPTANGDTSFNNLSYPSGSTARGALYSSLNATEQAAVQALIQAWVATQAPDIAQTLLANYTSASALATTYVAYAVGLGGSADFGPYPNAKAKPGSASNSYLRVDGPAVWIEFLVKSEDGTAATNVYYNSIWRDKLADYGGQF